MISLRRLCADIGVHRGEVMSLRRGLTNNETAVDKEQINVEAAINSLVLTKKGSRLQCAIAMLTYADFIRGFDRVLIHEAGKEMSITKSAGQYPGYDGMRPIKWLQHELPSSL